MSAAVTKKLWSVALLLGLVLAACGSGSPGAQTVKTSFVPQTVDFLDDVGRGVSLALDKDGNPHLAYIGLIEKVEKGEIPPALPATAPALPAVLTASEKEGVFSHGFVVQTDISSAAGKKVPVDESSATGIAIAPTGAVDVVWNQVHGVFFATAPTDAAPFGDPQTVADEYGTSPAVAVDSKGNPWVAWVQQERSTGAPFTIQAATLEGKKWTTEKVGDLGTCDPAPCPPITVGIAVANDVPTLAYTNAGGSVFLATRGTTGWSTQTVQQDAKAYGASLAVDKDGSIHVAYETTTGEVRQAVATGPQAIWNLSTVGTFTPPTSTPGAGTETAVATDAGGKAYVAYTDPGDGSVVLASSNNGGQFQEIDTPRTEGGSSPAMGVDAQHKVNLAWYSTKPQDLELGIYPEQLGAYALPAPSTPATQPQATGGGGAKCPKDTVEIVAPVGAGGAGFQTTSVTAPSGDFTVCFDNEDTTAHNVQIFESADAPTGSPVAQDDVFAGPKADTFDVSGLAPGKHYFHCIVHPTTMIGTLTVK
jgi:plastocyanin